MASRLQELTRDLGASVAIDELTRNQANSMANTGHGNGQTALVTGASGGIGLDLAECFAQDGYDLILTARSDAALQQASQRLAKQYGVAATSLSADLGVLGAGRRLADAINARGLKVDVLVNNAGYGAAGATHLSRVGTPMTSMGVAQSGYRAFRDNQRVMITSARNKVTARLAAFLPRRILLGLVHSLQSPV
jgi:short-subunit dehydrogenase